MDNLTPKQRKKLERIVALSQKGTPALLEYLFEIEEQIPALTEIMDRLKGKPGDNYVLTQSDRKQIATIARSLLDEDVIAEKAAKLVQVPLDEIAVEASKLIKVPKAEKVNVKLVAKLASQLIKIPEVRDGIDADDEAIFNRIVLNLAKLGVSFRDGLELLQDDERLDVSAIKGIEEKILGLSVDGKGKYIVGGSRVLQQLLDVNIQNPTNGQVLKYDGTNNYWYNGTGGGGGGVNVETPTGLVNSSNTSFTVTNTPQWIVGDGITYFEGAGYSIVGLAVTMDLPPSQYIRSIY